MGFIVWRLQQASQKLKEKNKREVLKSLTIMHEPSGLWKPNFLILFLFLCLARIDENRERDNNFCIVYKIGIVNGFGIKGQWWRWNQRSTYLLTIFVGIWLILVPKRSSICFCYYQTKKKQRKEKKKTPKSYAFRITKHTQQ